MKKILTLIALLTGTALVYGQGTIVFYSGGGTTTGAYTNLTLSTYAGGVGALGTAGLGGGLALGTIPPPGIPNGYYYTLLFDTTTPANANPVTGGWTQAYNNANDLPLVATNNNVGAGGFVSLTSGNTQLEGLAAGATIYFELVGWSANLGSTWTAVSAEMTNGWTTIPGYTPSQNYFFGVAESSSDVTLGPSTGPGVTMISAGGLTDAEPGMLTMDTVVPIPEPSTLALAGLGGLSLLLFRRRK